ncbi:MAG TPA: T9SS type A sorting domain-containing protein, partial [Flavisolibacter sp.]|nr:T9SS type A sorting domain-containing protein [Flavisolibacter sp.]
GSDISVLGPVKNAPDIDTNSTGNMATFTYDNVTSFTFQYGGQSGSIVTNGGERLNSMWFKAFSLVNPVITLPISLQSFTARYDKNNVLLNWTTSSEYNFSHFVIERSIDGKHFTDIALVFGNGDVNQNASYSYKDAHVVSATGTIFYRLRTVDKTAEFSYSQIQLIRLNNEQLTISLTAFPNPVTDQLRLILPDNWQGKPVSFELYSETGARLQLVHVDNANQSELMKMGNITRGLYMLKATCLNETAEQRVVKN